MSGAAGAQTLPGWYGKLPFLGDFAGRRLPPSFVSTWDDWLQSVIYGGRSLLGEEWLTRYLNSPIWHFCLAPGVCGNNAWFGLLMSSVDRANRHFPFTLAHGVARESLTDLAMSSITRWLGALEHEAVAMLDLEGSVQALEDRLASFAPPAGLDDTRPRVADNLSHYFDRPLLVASSEVPALLAALANESTRGAGAAVSLWWSTADDQGRGALVWACQGLPSAEGYTTMLSGG
ncbi:type VI secretion system protein ImpM [Panacagrimonas perspica]|uniref:Type VI secretion system protein ImpM n=1 Tax=Panacagrimonas perspica TaxID=381431 RepID=A0A4V3UR69_9GAMM|nr:type VI secretion system-associated protein TagF [Panacagrimonas perspica]TDU31162.1 type VI secretion system protein ImpM [Panacagrimonas perspica]THD01711.1 type VI secretion-associated protein [Panacagrimonas perspica]